MIHSANAHAKSEADVFPNMKRASFHITAQLLVGLYKAFVLMQLWNWFVSPIFHISSISLFQAIGLFFVVALCTNHWHELELEYWSKRMMALLECYVPDDKKERAKLVLERSDDEGWRALSIMHFNDLGSTTIILVLSWVIHAYVA